MFYDVDHPNVSLSEWQSFLKDLPTHLIAEVIDRSRIGLPDWFVPFAPRDEKGDRSLGTPPCRDHAPHMDRRH